MPKGEKRFPKDKTEGQGSLPKVLVLVPLFQLVLQLIEIILKLVGRIK